MMTSKYIACLLTTIGLLGVSHSVQGGPLLFDDFNNNSLDNAVWTTTLPLGGSSVNEVNQRIELNRRGHLRTVADFDPLTVGPLRITGEWTFVSPGGSSADYLQITTRSDGSTTGNPNGEAANGIRFEAFGFFGDFKILRTVGAVNTFLASGNLNINVGETFAFEILDDGADLSFTLTEVGGDGTTGTLTATDTSLFGTNHVVFHNRETGVSYLDNVSIETIDETLVPEPTSFALVVMALGIITVYSCFRYGFKQRSQIEV